ncbi:hypothetical protein MW887_004394 [Aspergillus wentii]|nr:hypothetical protein MW887_004394 [Aspergillus wentii]
MADHYPKHVALVATNPKKAQGSDLICFYVEGGNKVLQAGFSKATSEWSKPIEVVQSEHPIERVEASVLHNEHEPSVHDYQAARRFATRGEQWFDPERDGQIGLIYISDGIAKQMGRSLAETEWMERDMPVIANVILASSTNTSSEVSFCTRQNVRDSEMCWRSDVTEDLDWRTDFRVDWEGLSFSTCMNRTSVNFVTKKLNDARITRYNMAIGEMRRSVWGVAESFPDSRLEIAARDPHKPRVFLFNEDRIVECQQGNNVIDTIVEFEEKIPDVSVAAVALEENESAPFPIMLVYGNSRLTKSILWTQKGGWKETHDVRS